MGPALIRAACEMNLRTTPIKRRNGPRAKDASRHHSYTRRSNHLARQLPSPVPPFPDSTLFHPRISARQIYSTGGRGDEAGGPHGPRDQGGSKVKQLPAPGIAAQLVNPGQSRPRAHGARLPYCRPCACVATLCSRLSAVLFRSARASVVDSRPDLISVERQKIL